MKAKKHKARYHIDARCFSCVHSHVCGRKERHPDPCRDFADRERYRPFPPCGETVIYWIYDTDFCECESVLDPLDVDPRVEESTVNVTAWAYDENGKLWGRYDDDWYMANHQYFYLSRGIAELALKTGSWRVDEEADL